MNRIVTMVLKNLPIVPGAWQKLCRYAKHPEKYSEEEMYRHIQYILKRAVRGGNIDLQVSGTENIPKEGGFMLYANHQGMFDVLAVAATCDIPVGAVLKKELYDIPFLHQVAICTKSFPMDREDVRQSLTVIQSVIREVKAGRNYLIFPEGTRNKGEELTMLPFKEGAFKIATKTGCPIVPISMNNTAEIFENHFPKIKKTHVVLEYGTPIYPNELDKDVKKHIGSYVQNIMDETIHKNAALINN